MAAPSLTTGSLSGHIRRIALPMSIGFFFNTMYNVVDSFYAGRISTEALAAMALSFPVFFIIIAISGGLSRGASALIANAIGAKDTEEEATLSGQVFSLAILSAIVRQHRWPLLSRLAVSHPRSRWQLPATCKGLHQPTLHRRHLLSAQQHEQRHPTCPRR